MPSQSQSKPAVAASPPTASTGRRVDQGLENSSQIAAMSVAPAEEEGGLLACVAPSSPFENGATRGDFVWGLARDLAGRVQDGFSEAVSWAMSQGIMNGREHDPISRAEAAVMLRRFLKLPTELPEGGVAYFSDVEPSDWYFDDAHAARLYGLFVGNNNAFSGDDALTADQARLVLGRASSAAVRTPEQQSPGLEPRLQPADRLEALLQADELSYEDIGEAREKIAAKPEDERPALYREVAARVGYRNQRDNEGTYAATDSDSWGYAEDGDVMCNVTSAAMALNQLGIGADESTTQLEDQLDEEIVEGGLGSRYELGGQRAVAEKHGAEVKRIAAPSFRDGAAAQAFYEDEVLPLLEQGASATMSIAWGPKSDYYHIVRLQWVEADGLTVDDPYGEIVEKADRTWTYDKNDADSAEGDGAKGQGNAWSWDAVAALNSGRYVQILTVAGQ